MTDHDEPPYSFQVWLGLMIVVSFLTFVCVSLVECMTYFYRFMLWCLRHEIIIARSTGRNPANIQQLQREISDLELKQ